MVFVDTSAFAALENRRDEKHVEAIRLRDSARKKGETLITSDYVLDETLTLLSRRAGRSIAIDFGAAILASKAVTIHRITSDVFGASWRLFSGYQDKEFSFTDCTSFALMKELGSTEAFTFDRHFEQAGFLILT